MTTITLPWKQPGWHANAHAWIRHNLQAHQLRLTGEIEQKYIRNWSTVLTVPTSDGTLYFKAGTPLLSHEPALTSFLASQRPDILPDLLAVELTQGWMLMRDSGRPIREWVKPQKSLDRWLTALPLFAELQMQMAGNVDEMLALGTLDRRLETLPAQFSALLADRQAMLLDQPESLTSANYQQLLELPSVFEEMCRSLAGCGIPHTIHHGDLSNSNVYFQGEQVIFTDWAEGAVTHPFFSLLITLRSCDILLDINEYDPFYDPLINAYLQPWTKFASLSDLRRIFTQARKIAMVNHALNWYISLVHLDDATRAENAIAVPAWLLDFLNHRLDE
jgi:hypothetical protein